MAKKSKKKVTGLKKTAKKVLGKVMGKKGGGGGGRRKKGASWFAKEIMKLKLKKKYEKVKLGMYR